MLARGPDPDRSGEEAGIAPFLASGAGRPGGGTLVRSRLLAWGLAALAAGGCADRGDPSLAGAEQAAGRPAPSPAKEAARLIWPAIWGVVPEAPRYKRELRPELIRGSAVAVSEGRLLASCGAVGGRQEVGLVRHNKYYKAWVARAAGGRRGVCELLAPGAPLAAAPGFRSPDDLRVGEPVYAVVSRTSAEFAVAEGRVTGKRPAAGGARWRRAWRCRLARAARCWSTRGATWSGSRQARPGGRWCPRRR